MTAENPQNQLMDALQHYINQTDFAHLTAIDQPDLSTLFSDLAGLKSEVKSESRQFKATLDTLCESLSLLKADNQSLQNEFSAKYKLLQQQLHDSKRTILLDFLDIYDRLSDGYHAAQNYKPLDNWFSHSKPQDRRFIESLAKGQEITLKRFEQGLQRHGVIAIDCIGTLFDAHKMTTLEIGNDPQFDNGIVLEELRKGFLFAGQVLRLAEVKVNKL